MKLGRGKRYILYEKISKIELRGDHVEILEEGGQIVSLKVVQSL